MKRKSPNIKFTGKVKEFMYLNSYINIIDNKKVVIENCKQILECNEVMALVATGSFQIEIWGKGLTLSNYCTDSVEVTGVVESVALTSKKQRKRDV